MTTIIYCAVTGTPHRVEKAKYLGPLLKSGMYSLTQDSSRDAKPATLLEDLEKMTNEEVRACAKKEGMSDWDTARPIRLRAKLGKLWQTSI